MERAPERKDQERLAGSVVLFDVDNTLYKGFTVFEFTTVLRDKGLITDQAHVRILEDRTKYRNGIIDYHQFATNVVGHYYQALAGRSITDIQIAGQEFIPSYESELMPFATQLIEYMQTQGELFVISGAPSEAFIPLAARFNIPSGNLFLLEGMTNNGIYTGEVKTNMAVEEEKNNAVEAVKKSGFNPQVSFAFGDSSGDLPILEAVENRFIVEPGEEMRQITRQRGWDNSIVDRNTIFEVVTRKIAEVRNNIR